MEIHVDDCYELGNQSQLNELVKEIEQQGLKIKDMKDTDDYLSCQIIFNKTKTKAWMGQPYLIKRLEKNFEHLIEGNIIYRTPGTPGYNIVRPTTEEDKISAEDQKIYRSAVGSLLQFIKYSRPDISNTVRELSKCMDGANPEAFKEMKRVIKFLLNTKTYGLKLNPKMDIKDEEWSMTVYTDSNWAGDKDNRRSVSGYIIFLKGVPILWKSRLQRTISLSSSEAEYYALSEAAKEI